MTQKDEDEMAERYVKTLNAVSRDRADYERKLEQQFITGVYNLGKAHGLELAELRARKKK